VTRATQLLLAGLGTLAGGVTFQGTLHAAPAGTSTKAEIGQKAPAFQLVDQDRKPFRLRDDLGRQPIVLVFYRGYW
jgi:hypothetical protein